jgi:formate dehydrogenase subunit delta
MTAATLLRMAGDIAAFFRHEPEAEAAAGIAGHINAFWTPTMRRDLLEACAAAPERVPALVRAALPLIRVKARAAAQEP